MVHEHELESIHAANPRIYLLFFLRETIIFLLLSGPTTRTSDPTNSTTSTTYPTTIPSIIPTIPPTIAPTIPSTNAPPTPTNPRKIL